MSAKVGKVVQIIGPVVDVSFPGEKKLPNILEALIVKRPGGDLILECQQHIGEDTIRTVSMDSTEGLARGTETMALTWMPTSKGFADVREALRELLGRLVGA